MSNFDVAIRAKFVNQLGAGAKQAERDLKGIGNAAKALGNAKGGTHLASDTAKITTAAKTATKSLSEVKGQAQQLNNVNLGGLAKKLNEASREVTNTRRRINTATVGVSGKISELESETTLTSNAMGALAGTAAKAWGAVSAFIGVGAVIKGLSDIEERVTALDRKYASLAVTVEQRDPAFVQKMRQLDTEIGLKYGMTPEEVEPMRQSFGAAGLTPDQIENLTGMSAKGVKAMDATGGNVAQALIAAVQNLDIPATKENAERVLDMISKGTKLGSFESESVAKFLPQFAAQYAGLGMKGFDALAEINALAQIVRKGSGTPDEAGTNLQNLFAKIASPDAVKNFKEKGVDLRSVAKRAKKEGKSYAEAVIEEVMRITKGDEFKMGELFGDMQVKNALRPLTQFMDQYRTFKEQIEKESSGTLEADWQFLKQTPAERQARLKAITDAGLDKMGKKLQPAKENWERVKAWFFNSDELRRQDYIDKLGTPSDADKAMENEKYQRWRTMNQNRGGRGGAPIPNKPPYPEIEEKLKKTSLAPAAKDGMDQFNATLKAEGTKSEAWAREMAAKLQQILSFKAHPTISPSFMDNAAPAGASAVGGTGKQSSISQTNNYRISGHSPETVARRVARAQDRDMRRAQAASLHDLGALA